MGISGSDPALMYALSGVARAGATRAGYHSGKVFVKVDGVQRAHGKPTASHEVEKLTATLNLDAEPNHVTFQAKGWLPETGMEVIITLGSINNLRRLFAGQVMGVQEGYQTHKELPSYGVRAIDWTWGLGRVIVSGRYTGSASTIAETLMGFAPTGYTADRVEAGLPTVTGGITFTNRPLPAALTALAKRIGANWYIDEYKRLNFYTTNAFISQPQTLTASLSTLKHFHLSRDLSQIITRVYVEGGGSTAMVGIAVGETIIPVNEPQWYASTGGTVVSGPQRITYTGVDLGEGGALVGPGVLPTTAVTLALASGSGVDVGAHSYAQTFVTGAGESLPSPIASITVSGTLAAPSSAPSTAPASAAASGISPGNHQWGYTFVTAAGETTISPVTGVVTLNAVTAPPTPTVQEGAVGSLDTGVDYRYKIGYTTTHGISSLSAASAAFQTATGSIWVSVAQSADSRVTGIALFRTEGGSAGPYKLLFTVSNHTQLYVDQTPDGSLGTDAPSSDTASFQTVPLSGIATGGGLVTSRKVYRKVGSAAYKLAFTIANNTATTAADSTADASLGADAPSSNTATAAQVSVSGISVGPSGTTDRKVYRTPVGSSQLKLLATVAGNSTTVYTDSTADSSLGANVPTSDTSGLTQPTGQVVPGAASIPISGATGFSAGWAVVGNGQQLVRYTSVSGSSLIGVPASGEGSIRAAVNYGSTITPAPQLTGIPASGAGSVRYAILQGDDVNLFVQRDDLTAQAALAARLNDGTDGVVEWFIQDRRLSQSEAEARGDATLTLRSSVLVAVSYTSRDFNTQPGADAVVNIGAPTNATGTFKIQQVVVGDFQNEAGPTYRAEASNVRFSLEQLLQSFREG